MNLGLDGKKALVCASSKGLGKATALALAAEGVHVFLCGRNEQSLQAAAADVQTVSKHPVHWQTCNLTDHTDRDRLIQAVKETFGTLDILVNNVGGPPPSTVEDTSLLDWQAGFERLFLSVAHLTQTFLPGMKAKQWGRILTITSISVPEPVPNLAVSNAMRSAVTSLMKTLASEVAAYNITVNCVAPGMIHTDRIDQLIATETKISGNTVAAQLQKHTGSIPAGRLGRPEEFGSLVCYLASEPAGYLTGTTLLVDGGKRKATY